VRSRYLYPLTAHRPERQDSVVQYETAIKADEFLVMARGSADEMGRAKTILATMSPSHLAMHVRADVAEALEKARGAA
jgi:hypothetical protein